MDPAVEDRAEGVVGKQQELDQLWRERTGHYRVSPPPRPIAPAASITRHVQSDQPAPPPVVGMAKQYRALGAALLTLTITGALALLAVRRAARRPDEIDWEP